MTTTVPGLDTAPTTHSGLLAWVRETAELTQPDRVEWVDGSAEEWTRITDLLVENGTFVRLNPDKKPNSFWCASDPTDVARVEDRTFICSRDPKDAGATNNWMDPDDMKADPHRALPRLDARPHDVRAALLHGPARPRTSRCSASRSPTRPTSSRRCTS